MLLWAPLPHTYTPQPFSSMRVAAEEKGLPCEGADTKSTFKSKSKWSRSDVCVGVDVIENQALFWDLKAPCQW